MPYNFSPPVAYRQAMSNDPNDPLWSRVKFDVAYTVIKTTTGGYRREAAHDPDAKDIAVIYLGGHVYPVSDAEAASLTAAGYGDRLTVIA